MADWFPTLPFYSSPPKTTPPVKSKRLCALWLTLIAFSSALGSVAQDDIGPPPAPPEGWTDGYAFGNGIRIHYWRTGAGSGKPTMVMTHGSSDYGLCWTQLAKEFEQDYDIIMPDARGHGLTDPPRPTDSPDAQVEDLAAVVRELELSQPVMMGHSMGSSSLAWFAARYPDIPRAVILEDPGIRPRSGYRTDAEAQHQTHLRILRRNNLPFADLVAQSLARQPQWGLEETKIWAVSKHHHHPATAYTSREGRPATPALFKAITATTLILKADDQGELRQQNEEITAHLKHGKIVHVPGAAHNVRRDQKARVIAEMTTFLATL